MLNGLSLFSGIGGLDVALSNWVRPIAYCEIDPYCQGVLLSRMATGDLVHAPIWDDIKTLRIRPQEIDIDIIYGGFPCQDISIAGHGKGLDGERSGLFFEIMRLAKEIKPTFIFLENVPAITTRGGLQVVREITEMGYDCRWCVISAASVGAMHKRGRFFLLARSRREGVENASSYSYGKPSIQANPKAFSLKTEKRARMGFAGFSRKFEAIYNWQKNLCSMAWHSDGIPFGMEQSKCFGNAVVPQQAKEAFKILMGIKEH